MIDCDTLKINGTEVDSSDLTAVAGLSDLTATTAEINQYCDESAKTEIVTATNVITAAESGKTFFLNSATEFDSTLPVMALGLNYRFIVAAAPSGASYTITPTDADKIIGHTLFAEDAGGSGDTETTAGADVITFVDGKAVAGDWVEVWCDGVAWYASGRSAVNDAITFTG